MHVAMPVGNKEERANIRIRTDIKDDARALAEHLGFGGKGLTALITHLLVEAIKTAKKNEPELFADAFKRVSKTAVARVAIAPPSNISERKHGKSRRISASGRTRAVSGGRKR